jgi:ATP-dependent Zn protease
MDEELGTLVYMTDENSLTKPFSEHTAEMIDTKLRAMAFQLYEQAKALVSKNKNLMIVL